MSLEADSKAKARHPPGTPGAEDGESLKEIRFPSVSHRVRSAVAKENLVRDLIVGQRGGAAPPDPSGPQMSRQERPVREGLQS